MVKVFHMATTAHQMTLPGKRLAPEETQYGVSGTNLIWLTYAFDARISELSEKLTRCQGDSVALKLA